MGAKEELKQELGNLVGDMTELLKLARTTDDLLIFNSKYQAWYTKALRIVTRLAPDRLEEFRSYYQIDPKRKQYNASTYVIQDYIKGRGANTDVYDNPTWDIHNSIALLLFAQVNIGKSVESRIEGVLANLEGSLLSEIQDAELATAEKLRKVSARAGGALAGVVLEDHLQRVAQARSVKISKRNPTISDLNDPLKQAGVYDSAAWRRIQFLADLRNLCSHKKDRELTEEEVGELISGVNWAVKNIF